MEKFMKTREGDVKELNVKLTGVIRMGYDETHEVMYKNILSEH